jgi:hypothetical protein
VKGLIIDEPWLSKILDGQKSWEIRSRNCNIRGQIGVVRKGSGHVIGTAEVVDSIGPLSRSEVQANTEKHCSTAERIFKRYESPYAWVLANPRRLRNPIPYNHKPGSVIWVSIPDIPEDALEPTR